MDRCWFPLKRAGAPPPCNPPLGSFYPPDPVILPDSSPVLSGFGVTLR
jgi:hypothetical protein